MIGGYNASEFPLGARSFSCTEPAAFLGFSDAHKCPFMLWLFWVSKLEELINSDKRIGYCLYIIIKFVNILDRQRYCFYDQVSPVITRKCSIDEGTNIACTVAPLDVLILII